MLYEIAQALRDHLFFQELDLRFISCLAGCIIAEIDELLPESSQTRREFSAYGGRAAIGIRNITVTLHRSGPGTIVVRATDGDGLLAMDAGISTAIHHYVS